MSTLIFAPETFNLAEVTRGIEIAKHLRPVFRCVFMGYSKRFASPITEAGFEFRLLRPTLSDAQADQLLAFDQGRSLTHPFTREMLRTRVINERTLIHDLGAAAVVIGTTISQFISARAEQVPLAYAKPFPYSSPHLHYMRHTGVILRASRLSQLADNALAALVRTAARHITYIPKMLRVVASENNVSLNYHSSKLLDADLNLLTTIPELAPAGIALPNDHLWVGPIFAHLDTKIPPLVDRLSAAPDPVVYVSMGSSGSRDLILRLLRSLSSARAQILAPVSQFLSENDTNTLPANVHVCSWLPAHLLGDRVDMAITHGGEGTVQNSCVSGWPFIGIPLQLEQRYNVQACVDAGAAKLVPPRAIERIDWAALIAAVLNDAPMRRAASRLSQLLRNIDGAARAADAIRKLVPPAPCSPTAPP